MTPTTEADVTDIIKAAQAPLRIVGGNTRPIARTNGTALPVSGLSGVTLYEPGALTLVVKAGTPVAEIENALSAENQRLAFEPMDHRPLMGSEGVPTIGGVVAANVSGPRRIAVGACRDFLLGVRFVDGAGQIIKNGGRVMKNVTGYDLVKLMCGAYGTLGALTEVSLKVLPQAETEASLVIHGLSTDQAVTAMSAALGSPYEVTGAAVEAGDTVVRIEGFAGSVAYRTGELTRVLQAFGPVSVLDGPGASAARWAAIRDVTAFAGNKGDVWRISVRPSAAPAVVAGLPEGSETVLDWAGGLIWAAVPAGTDLRTTIPLEGGHMTLMRGTAAVPTFQPEPAPLAAISAGLRQKFDPKGILNAGAMG